MPHSDLPLLELEDFAIELAHTAGGIARAYFRKSFTIENKGAEAFDPVTNADKGIEQILRTAIVERYPDHGIVGEEQADRGGSAPYRWYIDPIDGTRAFMTGSPLWGTLVGLTCNDVPVFGLMCQPVLEEVFFGSTSGSWLIKPDRRERLRARPCKTLASAVLASTHPGLFDEDARQAFEALGRECLMTRFGGDCYNYAMVAAGFVDLVVESRLRAYDIVPLIPILEGAGAVVTDWEGRIPLNGGSVVAAATPELHAQALERLRQAAARPAD
jgi:histidinol phosphatase-like enzyme (inositol monophosphatase family)